MATSIAELRQLTIDSEFLTHLTMEAGCVLQFITLSQKSFISGSGGSYMIVICNLC